MSPMVPLRVMMEALGWKVVYETGEGSPPNVGPSITVTAPYEIEYQREDLDPDLRGKRGHPFLILPWREFSRTGIAYAFSPQMNMAESPVANPLPRVVQGQMFVPLDFLEDAIARIEAKLGARGKDLTGKEYVVKRGIQVSVAAGEIRILYMR